MKRMTKSHARCLMSRAVRLRRSVRLAYRAAVDLFWHIVPNFADARGWAPQGEKVGHFFLTPWDIIVPVAMASIWIALFFYNLTKRPLIPVYHPLVPEILEPSHGAH